MVQRWVENNMEASEGTIMHKGYKHTEEAKKRMSESGKGRRKSEEEKKKMSASHMGKPRSQDTKDKISAGKLRHKFSEQHLANLRESLKPKYECICQHCGQPFIGKRGQKYCSKQHQQKDYRAKRKADAKN